MTDVDTSRRLHYIFSIVGSYFITATDTGVGKTVVSAALAQYLKKQGYSVAVMKPLATGGIVRNKKYVSEDVLFHQRALGKNENYELLNPYCFLKPLSPYAASILEKKNILIKKIISAYKALSEKYDIVIVEGIGGILVPIKKNYFVADLTRDMKLPLLIIARPGLGTLNHTLMTIKTAQSYQLKIAGIIFNHTQKPAGDISEKTNAEILRQLTSIPVLGTFPYDPHTNMQKGIIGKKLQNAAKKLMIKLMKGNSKE